MLHENRVDASNFETLARKAFQFNRLHEAIILWDGEEREVRILATGRRPLIGTVLLNEQELVIQFTEGGLVTIDEL